MSDYTKSTNFAAKDALLSGNPNKVVSGTEINTEFDNIQTSNNSKADKASPTFTGTVNGVNASFTGTFNADGAATFGDITSDGTVDFTAGTVTLPTIASLTITSVDINGGTVDGTIIGGTTPAAITATTLNATGGGSLTGTWSDLGTVTTIDINGGTVDGTVVGGTTPAAITATTLNATGGGALTGTWSDLGTVTTVDINGGTIDGTTQASGTINGPIAAGGTWTAAATWTLPAFTLGGTVTSNGQSFSGTIADLGTVTTVDIDGGTIDNTVIGGTTPAAVSGTTGDFSSDLTVDGNVGIGTTPSNPLDVLVRSNSVFALDEPTDTGGGFRIKAEWDAVTPGTEIGNFEIDLDDGTGGSEDSSLIGRYIVGGTLRSAFDFNATTHTYGNNTDNPNHVMYGNVGIGTTPGYPVDVVSQSDATAYNIRGRSADSIGLIRFGDNSNSPKHNIQSRTDRLRFASLGASFDDFDFVDSANASLARINSSGLSLDGGSNYLSSPSTGNWEFAGNVGIGASPFRQLTVSDGTTSSILNLYSSNADSSILEFGDTDDINVGRIEYDHANDTMNLRTSAADRLTISSSGLSLDGGSNYQIDGSGNVRASGFLGLGASVGLVISSGVVTATKSFHSIDTEGSAATDDLDTINGGSEGDILVLRSGASSRDPTIKDATGNLRLEGDFTLSSATDKLTLIKRDAFWDELSRSNND